eukprot:747334-Hanusia_phi.AAC.1
MGHLVPDDLAESPGFWLRLLTMDVAESAIGVAPSWMCYRDPDTLDSDDVGGDTCLLSALRG